MSIETGGPAFPHIDFIESANGFGPYTPDSKPGMSLRDWFAGQSLVAIHMQSLVAIQMGSSANPNRDDIAVECYRQADAMLAARTIGAPQP